MDDARKQAQSERMKKYWAEKRVAAEAAATPEPPPPTDEGALEVEEAPDELPPEDLVSAPSEDSLRAEYEALRKKAEAAGMEFEKITGFKDEYDRFNEGRRAWIHEFANTTGRGATDEEIEAYALDNSRVDWVTERGHEFLRSHKTKWVNRLSRDGVRIQQHLGWGFFIVNPSKWGKHLRPSAAIKREDEWILGDVVLMAETMENFKKRVAYSMRVEITRSKEMQDALRSELKDALSGPDASWRVKKAADRIANSVTGEVTIGQEMTGVGAQDLRKMDQAGA